jgi:hypothetical protein
LRINYKIIIFAEAKIDIKEAAIWYNDRQSGLGKRFVTAIKNEIAIIKQNPFLYEIRYDDIRTALIETFPYLIHFDIINNTVFIKAVFHTSRNTEIWIER